MKKVILVIVCLLGFTSAVFCQNTLNKDDLIGYWKDNTNSTHLFFWKDTNGEIQVQEITATSGEPLDLIVLRVNEDNVFIATQFKPKNWIVESVYTFINKITLKCVVTGDAHDTIYYTKIK